MRWINRGIAVIQVGVRSDAEKDKCARCWREGPRGRGRDTVLAGEGFLWHCSGCSGSVVAFSWGYDEPPGRLLRCRTGAFGNINLLLAHHLLEEWPRWWCRLKTQFDKAAETIEGTTHAGRSQVPLGLPVVIWLCARASPVGAAVGRSWLSLRYPGYYACQVCNYSADLDGLDDALAPRLCLGTHDGQALLPDLTED